MQKYLSTEAGNAGISKIFTFVRDDILTGQQSSNIPPVYLKLFTSNSPIYFSVLPSSWQVSVSQTEAPQSNSSNTAARSYVEPGECRLVWKMWWYVLLRETRRRLEEVSSVPAVPDVPPGVPHTEDGQRGGTELLPVPAVEGPAVQAQSQAAAQGRQSELIEIRFEASYKSS